jgi:hypothetical protein
MLDAIKQNLDSLKSTYDTLVKVKHNLPFEVPAPKHVRLRYEEDLTEAHDEFLNWLKHEIHCYESFYNNTKQFLEKGTINSY